MSDIEPQAIDPRHAADAAAISATLNHEQLAQWSNDFTGGSMRPEDSERVMAMVAATAMRTPGYEHFAAGFGAVVRDGRLLLWFAVPVANQEVPITTPQS